MVISLSAVPAMANEVVEEQMTATVMYRALGAYPNFPVSYGSGVMDTPRYNVNSAVWTSDLMSFMPEYDFSNMSRMMLGLSSFRVTAPTNEGFVGNIAMYVSYYYTTYDPNAVSSDWQYAPYGDISEVTITNSNGEQLMVSQYTMENFTPDSSYIGTPSKGYMCKFEFEAPVSTPLVEISLGRDSWNAYIDTNYYERYGLIVPSAVFLTGRTSEEVAAIEELTQIVIEQNNISNQYYTNVISKVDQIYNEVNNIQELQQEVINRMDEFNNITSIPAETVDKTQQAAQLITGLEGLEKPAPDQIVPDITVDTTQFADAIAPIFQNALIMQILLMSLGFAFVSYVLYGKK